MTGEHTIVNLSTDIRGHKIGPTGDPIFVPRGENVLLLGTANAWFVIGWKGKRIFTMQAPTGTVVRTSVHSYIKEGKMVLQLGKFFVTFGAYYPKGTTLMEFESGGAVVDVVPARTAPLWFKRVRPGQEVSKPMLSLWRFFGLIK
jgi:hypothetical protein